VKGLFVSLLVAVALSAPLAASSAKAPPCVVTPNPLSLSNDPSWFVSAAGATPLDYYEVTKQQKGHHVPDEGRVWLGQADEGGNILAEIGTVDGRLVGDGVKEALWPGDVSVKVVRYRAGGGPGGAASLLATCGFQVVE
jgi:hypothetical protein